MREANWRHRLHSTPNEDQQSDSPDAEDQLHADVYFLCLAIRRILLFADLLAKHVPDARLAAAREAFERGAPQAKRFRDFYEHLDEYLLDAPSKHVKVPGRAAPIVHSFWESDNVVISFAGQKLDITLAATAAIELGTAALEVWLDHLEAAKVNEPSDLSRANKGVRHRLETTIGVSTIIGREGETQVTTGGLIDVRVSEATPEE